MRKEETQLLPLAERHLTNDDWRALDRAFALNRDPIAGIEERDFQKLFSSLRKRSRRRSGRGGVPVAKSPSR